jgi:hypothetical protein
MHPETTRFRFAADRAVSKVVDGDAIVIDTVTGRYFSLEGTAEVAWSLLVASHSPAEVAAELRERYEAGNADVLADVSRLVEELVAQNLLVEASGAETVDGPVFAGDRSPYSAPELTVFTDMEDLLAFDPPLPVADVSVWTAKPDAE